jgi:hypothetical protein
LQDSEKETEMIKKYIVEYSTISAASASCQWVAYEDGADGDDLHAYGFTPAEALANLVFMEGVLENV